MQSHVDRINMAFAGLMVFGECKLVKIKAKTVSHILRK